MGDWEIDGNTTVIENVSLTPATLSLTFLSDDGSIDTWRNYDQPGDFRVREGYAGEFEVLDRGNNSKITVDPPADRKPPFDKQDYYVQSYRERKRAANQWEISLTLQRDTNRKNVYSAVDESADDWEFDFPDGNAGTITLPARRVLSDSQSGTKAGPTRTLPVLLDDDQAKTLIDQCGYPGGVHERAYGDAENIRVDETNRHRVNISVPAGEDMPATDYLITGWRLDLDNYSDTQWRVELSLWSDTDSTGTPRLLIVDPGETYSITDGNTESYPRARVEGTLDLDGTLCLD